MSNAPSLLEAVRTLRAAQPGLGVKHLVARLRAEQPGLGAEARLVREALGALERESEAAAAPAAASAPATADEGGGAPSPAAQSLACAFCGRPPEELGVPKFQVCPRCAAAKLPATYICGPDCPANPAAWRKHNKWHKELEKDWERWEDGGAARHAQMGLPPPTCRHRSGQSLRQQINCDRTSH